MGYITGNQLGHSLGAIVFFQRGLNMQVKDIIHGFELVRRERVEEAASEAFEFRHVKSGAKLLYLQNKDDNKVFSISFRTPPKDDTGVPHIMEHSTLCGSRKFPLKEPFVELVKGSLNTFLNAMTFADKTMYPVASCNDKDFHNLMDVYLDAVFYPAIYDKPEILLQEGWHYEIEKPEEPLRYSGVVYNEMKGALSSPDDLLENCVLRSLFPDNTYSCESGGNPAHIPELTYEQFIAFHKEYYSPANSYIYLYGDMDIEEQLAFIDGEYLQHFDLVKVPALEEAIPLQKPFGEMKVVHGHYPIAPEESKDGKTFLSCNLVMAEAGNHRLISALSLLEQALLKTPAAPLRKALIDAGLGMDVSSRLDADVRQPYLAITVNGSEPDKLPQFRYVLYDTLNAIVEQGIDRTILEASLNLMEFQMREADFGSHPKGLIYDITLMTNWLYDEDPLDSLRYEADIKFLREQLQTDFYEQLIQKYFLDNNFGAFVTMEPSNTLGAEQDARMAAQLAEKKAAMSPEEIESIIESTAALKLRQQTPDTPDALATIPLLKLEDINEEPKHIPMEQRSLNGIPVLFTPAATNGIVYLNLYFDADVVPQELIPYLYIYTDMLGLVDTAHTPYEDMANLVNMNTGGVAFDLENPTREGEPDSMRPMFRISAKAFMRKLPVLSTLLGEILTSTEFKDKKRLLELLQQNRSETELHMLQQSVQVALSRLQSFLSKSGVYNELGDLSLYPLLTELTDNFEANVDDLCAKLAQVGELLFSSRRLTIGVTLQPERYEEFAKGMEPLLTALQKNTKADAAVQQVYALEPVREQEGLLSSSQVQYVAKGANLCKLGYEVSGCYSVLDVILRYEYFWTKIRVQGGAYGAMTRFRQDGEVLFVSYRDPNLGNTLEVFDHTPYFLENFDVSDREMLKYIIGAISNVDTPLTPRQTGLAAQRMYFRGTTLEARRKRRSQLLHTTVEDIRSLAPAIAACMEENNMCVFGNAGVIKENAELFSKLTQVMD